MLDAEEREVSSRGRLDLLLEQLGVDDAPFGADDAAPVGDHGLLVGHGFPRGSVDFRPKPKIR